MASLQESLDSSGTIGGSGDSQTAEQQQLSSGWITPRATRPGGLSGHDSQDARGGEATVAAGFPMRVETFKVGDSQWQVWSQSLSQWVACEIKAVFIAPCRDADFDVPARSIKVQSTNGVKYIREFDIPSWMRVNVNRMDDQMKMVVAGGPPEHGPSSISSSRGRAVGPAISSCPPSIAKHAGAPSKLDAPPTKRPRTATCTLQFKLESMPAELLPYIEHIAYGA